MTESRVAVISDVHGNRWALEAVLRDIERRGVRRIVNLGDSLYGPLDPAGTADILLPLDLPTVRGNEDRIIIEAHDPDHDTPTLRFVKECLTPAHLAWLRNLTVTSVTFDDFLLCHACPLRDDEYLFVGVRAGGTYPRQAGDLMRRLSSIGQRVILSGHDHVPRTRCLPDGRLLVNPGSVGLPAYQDSAPLPHVMETGTPHARYGIVVGGPSGWRAENVALLYDWESAATTAERNGRPDWAAWIRTGCANQAE